MRPSSLSAVVRRGALWSIATTAMLKIANVLTMAVVAHILDPSDFGVYAVALTAYGIISAVGELGLGLCLIRADLDIDALAPTMATVALTTNAMQAAALAVFAKQIATALGSVAAAAPIRVLALAMLLGGLFAVPGAQLIRDFKQDKIFLANLIGFLPSTAVLIMLALHGGGAMAFAWSMVASTTISGFVMLGFVRRHYRPGFSRGALRVLVKFGFPLAGANIVNYVLLNGDYAVVGHLAGAVALGAYVLAFNVASWPTSLLGFMVNNVSMPAFSRVKSDAARLKGAIAKSVRAISLVVMPMSALTIALAHPLVLTLYGPKWSTSVEPLPYLAVYGAVSIICILFANILASLGRAKYILLVQLVWLAALAPGMVLGVHLNGIVGAAVAHVVVIGPLVLPMYLFGLRKTVDFVALVKAIVPALLAASVAALAAASAASQFSRPQVQLVAGLAAGGLVYALLAAPIAMTLVSQNLIAKLHARRILRFYDSVAQLLGLPVSMPKHAGKIARGYRGHMPRHAISDRSYMLAAGAERGRRDGRGRIPEFEHGYGADGRVPRGSMANGIDSFSGDVDRIHPRAARGSRMPLYLAAGISRRGCKMVSESGRQPAASKAVIPLSTLKSHWFRALGLAMGETSWAQRWFRRATAGQSQHLPDKIASDQPADPGEGPRRADFRRPPIDPARALVRGGPASLSADPARGPGRADFRRPPIDPASPLARDIQGNRPGRDDRLAVKEGAGDASGERAHAGGGRRVDGGECCGQRGVGYGKARIRQAARAR